MRPAIEVWRKALDATGAFIRFREKAAAVIEADRAEVVGEIVAWLNDQDKSTDVRDAADQIQAKFGARPALPEEYEGQL